MAKRIWDALVNAHEGTSQVRKFRIALLFTEYEAFKMKENKTLHEMMTSLTTLTNELTSLGKVISEEEQVKKVLRVLPKSKWNVKVTVIREANKELEGLTLDELVGNLRTYEMEIDGIKEQAAPEKILSLKASDIDETAFMAFGDSDIEEEDNAPEVSLLELKEKMHLFSKTKLVSMMSDSIDSLQELTSDRDELFNSLASLKFDFIDLKVCKHSVEKQNYTLKNQVTFLESSNNDLKSEVLKLTLTENGKRAMSKEQEKAELELTKFRFFKKADNLQNLCYICGNLGHPTTECTVAATSIIRSQNLATNLSQTKNTSTKIGQRNRSEMIKETKKYWYLDSACSRHMTGDKKKFLSLSKIDGGRVSFGNEKRESSLELGKLAHRIQKL
ncbi:uncharacterized protein LOC124885769 [Capsicum annuum]|uniref:uncharacterized protein LOC124885769 n=1 Tax=Capsicum annuum TaxID=4072 RepID=UPI001FB0769E|nr:uncharacterized protein LOC124885769 [Capsicum annuum]